MNIVVCIVSVNFIEVETRYVDSLYVYVKRHLNAILALIRTAYLRASLLADNFDDLVGLCFGV